MLRGSRKIASLTRMIRHRATSNMSDEPMILPTLLGLDTTSFALLDGADRTCQGWLSLGAVSRSVLFTTEHKLLRPGFGMGSEYVYIPRREAPESRRMIPIDAEILPSGLRASPLVLDFPARQSQN